MVVIVIGAGIGGLSAALALERLGVEAVVCERAPVLEEIGAGVALWPHALHALDRIGVGASIRALAGPAVDAQMRRPDGKVLQHLAATELVERWGAPFLTIHRAELQLALADAYGRDRIRLDHELLSHQADVDGVHAVFANGEVIEGEAVVGADGIRSRVRAGLLKDGPPRYRGDTAWRAVVVRPPGFAVDLPGFETIGQGRRFGATPMSGGRIQWFAGDACPAGGVDGPAPRDELMAMFGTWHDPIPELIQATPISLIRTDLYDRPPARRLADGRVALLGDAAHPMGPDLALGAGLAIEDGEALARAVARHSDVASAFRAYEQARLPRVRRIARRVALIGAAARSRKPFIERVRDGSMALVPQRVARRQLDSIVGRQPGADGSAAGARRDRLPL